MERRGREEGQSGDSGREQDPQRPDVGSKSTRSTEADPSGEGYGQVGTTRRNSGSWVNWQSGLYILGLATICFLLAPITSLWWVVMLCGTLAPLTLAVLDRTRPKPKAANSRKDKEQELLSILAERGELTPTTAAMRTSLTVDEASKMLEELAQKGHLKLEVEEGVMAYALRERDRHEIPAARSKPLESGDEDAQPNQAPAAKTLEDPLSERELEVLALLASGKTNSEIARDLFVSVGTVKSHTGNIYRKLEARNRAEALTRDRELELLQ